MFIHQVVESSNEQLRKRVESVLDMALTTVTSRAEAYESDAPTIESERKMKLAELEQLERTKIESSGPGDTEKGMEVDEAKITVAEIAV